MITRHPPLFISRSCQRWAAAMSWARACTPRSKLDFKRKSTQVYIAVSFKLSGAMPVLALRCKRQYGTGLFTTPSCRVWNPALRSSSHPSSSSVRRASGYALRADTIISNLSGLDPQTQLHHLTMIPVPLRRGCHAVTGVDSPRSNKKHPANRTTQRQLKLAVPAWPVGSTGGKPHLFYKMKSTPSLTIFW